jgi:hypothetical protein
MTKICELPECKNTFAAKGTKRFCCRAHKVKAYNRNYYATNRQEVQTQQLAYRETHRDEINDRMQDYYILKSGHVPGKCDVCGGRIRTDSKHGVCNKNPECRTELGRRRYQANNYYEANSHDELTYLMFSPGLNSHKIGITVNLAHRQGTLRNGCWDIELVTTFPYGRKLENWLHAYFAATRIAGTEWFTDLTEVDVKNAVAEYESTLAA